MAIGFMISFIVQLLRDMVKRHLRAKNGKYSSLLPLQAYHYHFSNDCARLDEVLSSLLRIAFLSSSLSSALIPTFRVGQRKHQIRSCTGLNDKSIKSAAINCRPVITAQAADDEFPIGCLIRSRRARKTSMEAASRFL
jgi:hypothetical protein